ncbi:hypothetical protein [Cedecea colo]|uniref:Uncharacterized protein n=1 Tax=Cedecea colo TaxID=2552946 RepID=A0ABX0VJQ7_9ENTR|nr:hypothetical protein [Cedecea colo]
MSSAAQWSYNKPCTFWKKLGTDEYGDPLGYAAPIIIMCDYIGGISAKLVSMGKEVVVKNTFFTAFALAEEGDYILIGESTDPDPLNTKADEVRASTQWNDTLDGVEDDWSIITGV